MKKLLKRDKKIRLNLYRNEKNSYILTSIFKNLNFLSLIRWNAFLKLRLLKSKNSNVSVTNRCLKTINKKRFNKLTNFSRIIFLRYIRAGHVNGFRRSSW